MWKEMMDSENTALCYKVDDLCGLLGMYQVIDDVEYSINEAIGFPENCKYWDVIEYCGR